MGKYAKNFSVKFKVLFGLWLFSILFLPFIILCRGVPDYCGFEVDSSYYWSIEWYDYNYQDWLDDGGDSFFAFQDYLEDKEGLKIYIDGYDTYSNYTEVDLEIYTTYYLVEDDEEETDYDLEVEGYTTIYDADTISKSLLGSWLFIVPYFVSTNIDWEWAAEAIEEYTEKNYKYIVDYAYVYDYSEGFYMYVYFHYNTSL
ncbi:MAG: hypothetical protein ACTSQG_07400, partial [Promethearchaeota archaeon]